eukprot:255491_1
METAPLVKSSFKWSNELKSIASISMKIGFANILELIPQFAATAFIGRLDNATQLLAGCGIATQFAAITGTEIAWGFCSALFTLAPQCLGANKKEFLAIYWQRCCYICLWVLIICTVIQLYAADILIAIGLPIELYPIINAYCRALIPFIWGMAVLTSLQRIAQTVDLNTELFWVVVVGAAASIPMNYLFVFYCDLGYIGTALTIDVTMWLDVICCIMVMLKRGYGFIFIMQPLSVIAEYDGIKEYLALAIPGLFQQGLAWWLNEVNIVLCGFIHNPSLAVAVTVVCTNLNMIFAMISVGIGNGVNIRLGFHIGTGNVGYAKVVATIGLVMDLCVLALMVIILVVFRHQLTSLWTDNESIISIGSSLTILVAIYQCAFNAFRVLSGVYSGLGYQRIAAIAMFTCQYVIAFTLVLFLLFYFKWRSYTLLGVYTVWGGSIFGLSVTSIVIFLLLIFKINWNNAVCDARIRINKASQASYGAACSSVN